MKILLTLFLFISFFGFNQNINELKNEINILDGKIKLAQDDIDSIDVIRNSFSSKISVINDSISLVTQNQLKYRKKHKRNVTGAVWSYTLGVTSAIMRFVLGTDKYPPYVAIGFGTSGLGFTVAGIVNSRNYKKTILQIEELYESKLNITESKQETSIERNELIIKKNDYKIEKQKIVKIVEKLESFDYQPNTVSKIVQLSNEKNAFILESYVIDSILVVEHNKRIGGLSFFKPNVISNSGTWNDYELSIKNNTDKRIKKIKFYLKGYNVVDEYIGSTTFTGLGWIESMESGTWSSTDFLYSRVLGSIIITKAVVEYEGGSKRTILNPKTKLRYDVISLDLPIKPIDYDYYNYGHIILIHNIESGELRYSIENPKIINVIDINIFKELIKNNTSKYIFLNGNGVGTKNDVKDFIDKYELLKQQYKDY